VAAVATGCGAGSGQSGGGAESENAGAIYAMLSTVPSGVACVQIAITGNTTKTQNFSVSAGTTPVLLNVGALTPGPNTVTVRAFNLACSSVTASSSPTWTGLPVAATVAPGVAVKIDVSLSPAMATTIGIDFNTGGASGSGGSGGMGGGGTGGTASPGCRWSCSGSTCVQVALDADGDGHGTTACAPAPGDDCDDTQATVYPGAPELCDGIDNDCDKKIDLSDGMPLIGAIQNVPSLNHAAVAAVTDGTFGVVGISPSISGLVAGSISSTGVASINAGPIFTPQSTTAYLDPHLAWSTALGQYGVLYQTNGVGGLNTRSGTMAATSCCWQDTTPPNTGRGDITTRGQGDLLLAAEGAGVLSLATQNASGMPLTSSIAVSASWDTYNPHVAAKGTTAGVIWQTASPRTLNWSLLSATLVPGTTEQLSTAALYADIEAVAAGYGIAWIEGLGFRFLLKNAAGATQCTSSVVPFGTVASNQQVAVSDSANGNLVVATSPDSNLVHLYRFDNSCKLMDDTDLSTTSTAPTEPRVVHGGVQVVSYWTDSMGGHYRWLSDLLCH
jgi:hypothetical protein